MKLLLAGIHGFISIIGFNIYRQRNQRHGGIASTFTNYHYLQLWRDHGVPPCFLLGHMKLSPQNLLGVPAGLMSSCIRLHSLSSLVANSVRGSMLYWKRFFHIDRSPVLLLSCNSSFLRMVTPYQVLLAALCWCTTGCCCWNGKEEWIDGLVA